MGPIDLKKEILKLKKQKNVLFLAHFYEDGDIQDLADVVGDSFQLAKAGQNSDADVVLLAGVVFMAESVKILNPKKKVIVPDLGAGCSLVKESPYEGYLKWRKENPSGIAVTYINSSAEVKAISDVIVTSSNAALILEAIPKDRPILFGPDRNLGAYLAKKHGKVIGKDMILWNGSCEVHVLFSAKKLFEMTEQNPEAVVLAHPECDETVLKYAHVIGSTSRLLEEVIKNPAKKFIVATETGIMHQMQKSRPDVELLQAPAEGSCGCNDCPYMKLNTLEKIHKSLLSLAPEVSLRESLRAQAQISLDRMMSIAAGRQVTWPDNFVEPKF